jgi:iron complex transport system ATP-binding protein
VSKLIAHNINYQITGKSILKEISLNLEAGKVLGVLGPNGAGKTSLLKILSGQIKAQGLVQWNQKAINDYSAIDLAKQVAVVNQLNQDIFALNLTQIVRMGLLPHKSLFAKHTAADEQLINDAIARVGLTNKHLQAFQSLSGGEQQRGLIARALVQQAALIVLDEPVNHLDVYYQHQVLGLLNALAHEFGITVVMSLHDLNLASEYCDQLCLLNQGQMVSQGSPQQVLQAKRLEQVFSIPCNVSTQNNSLRVDFYPPTSNYQSINKVRHD